jgi:hypothetical protein
MLRLLSLLLVAAALAGCASESVSPTETASPAGTDGAAFTLTSPAFGDGEPIPVDYTCDGEGISPPLAWSGPPGRPAAYALIEEDPDAGGFDHWVLLNIPGEWSEIAEGASGTFPSDPIEGANDAGEVGYVGSCPPSGTHRYVFTLYALSEAVPADVEPSRLTADSLRELIEGLVLEEAVLTGTYGR